MPDGICNYEKIAEKSEVLEREMFAAGTNEMQFVISWKLHENLFRLFSTAKHFLAMKRSKKSFASSFIWRTFNYSRARLFLFIPRFAVFSFEISSFVKYFSMALDTLLLVIFHVLIISSSLFIRIEVAA